MIVLMALVGGGTESGLWRWLMVVLGGCSGGRWWGHVVEVARKARGW